MRTSIDVPGQSQTPAVLAPLVLLVAVVSGGTIGYVLLSGWSVWDAFYMAVTTVATVGYREVHPLTRAGQAFTVVLIVGGVGSALYAFSAIAAVIIDGGWQRHFRAWCQMHTIDKLSAHYVLCGYGRIGAMVAQEFQRQGIPFVVVERTPELVRRATEAKCLAIEGDASRDEALKRARIQFARGLVAAVGTDAENVYTVLTARVLKSDLFVIARAESDDSIAKLKRAGADRVISPYRIGAMQIAQTALRPAVVDFVEIATSSSNLELSMEQVRIGHKSPLDGTSLAGSEVRERFGVVVVGLLRATGQMEFNPPPETMMMAGDHLVVLGTPDHLKDLARASESI